jgi:aspartate-semialdehyde dehydrogenase
MKLQNIKIAVIGATGSVGKTMLSILHDEGVPASNIDAVASSQSIGVKVSYGDSDILTIQSLEHYDFSDTVIALFSAGSRISQLYAEKATSKGCVVIDNTSYFRNDDDIPLIIPEINGDQIKNYKNKFIIANPNCMIAQVAMALAPLHHAVPIKRIVLSTYQSVSGAGKLCMEELHSHTKSSLFNNSNQSTHFIRPIAFNVIPMIGDICDTSLSTTEEQKIEFEIQKIIDPSIKLTATCVRVPVFIGHCASINVEFKNTMTVDKASSILKNTPGIMFSNRDITTPIDCVGEDVIYVNRLRVDNTTPNALNMWVVADNLRKGAALNAIQIAKKLIPHLND